MITRLRIGSRMILLFSLVGVLSISMTGLIAYFQAQSALKDSTFNRLTAVRVMKANEIEKYFLQIRNQVVSQASDAATAEAFRDLNENFLDLLRQSPLTPAHVESVQKYYEERFLPELKKTDTTASMEFVLPEDELTLEAQYRFISANANEVGNKQQLNDPDDGSSYSKAHRRYHPFLRDYLEKFGYYDIFLVNTEGRVIYTVFKEVDFATSLTKGPWKSTGLAHTFQKAMELGTGGQAFMVDFAPYGPSYGRPAAFIASPIDSDGRRLGVLIYQLPVGKINEIMTESGKWESAGLGSSGEMYLVGSDYTLRSESRFLIQDPEGYFKALTDSGEDAVRLKKIRDYNSGIGLQLVKTHSTAAAIEKKESGVWIIPDYRRVPVLSAYAPLAIADVTWAIISEVDESEAFADIYTLRLWILLSSLVILMLIVTLAYFFARGLTGPIQAMVHRLRDIAEGEGDLTQRIETSSKDELGDLATWFNRFVGKIHDLIVEIDESGKSVFHSSESLTESSSSLSSMSEEMSIQSHTIASSAEELDRTIQSMSSASEELSSSIDEMARQAAKGAEGARTARNESEQARRVMDILKTSADGIGSVVESIGKISNQINLLALNASIEAAGAGDAGKGFAVVAAEVKELARQSTESLEDIRRRIGEIQNSSGSAGIALANIDDVIVKVDEMNSNIAASVEEQSITMKEIALGIAQSSTASQDVARNISAVSEASQEVASSSEEASRLAAELHSQANRLKTLVGAFKINRAAGG